MKKQSQHTIPTTEFERPHRLADILVAGVDEAGRGALAGPVVAAAVILPNDIDSIVGVRDSKLIGEQEREKLFDVICSTALCFGIGIIENQIIDEINILQASFHAMHSSIQQLSPQPHHLLIDGNRFPAKNIPATTIVGGDSLSLSIAAASIIAKVTRDRIMRELDKEFPEYGFAQHKGYATAHHRNAILQHGESRVHRRSFLNKLYNAQQNLFENYEGSI